MYQMRTRIQQNNCGGDLVALFGNMVKKILIDKGMTQKSVAEKMNMSTNGINNLLNRDNISLDKMQAIATALNCRLVIDLVSIDDNKEV